jgi:hypothetical protein
MQQAITALKHRSLTQSRETGDVRDSFVTVADLIAVRFISPTGEYLFAPKDHTHPIDPIIEATSVAFGRAGITTTAPTPWARSLTAAPTVVTPFAQDMGLERDAATNAASGTLTLHGTGIWNITAAVTLRVAPENVNPSRELSLQLRVAGAVVTIVAATGINRYQTTVNLNGSFPVSISPATASSTVDIVLVSTGGTTIVANTIVSALLTAERISPESEYSGTP